MEGGLPDERGLGVVKFYRRNDDETMKRGRPSSTAPRKPFAKTTASAYPPRGVGDRFGQEGSDGKRGRVVSRGTGARRGLGPSLGPQAGAPVAGLGGSGARAVAKRPRVLNPGKAGKGAGAGGGSTLPGRGYTLPPSRGPAHRASAAGLAGAQAGAAAALAGSEVAPAVLAGIASAPAALAGSEAGPAAPAGTAERPGAAAAPAELAAGIAGGPLQPAHTAAAAEAGRAAGGVESWHQVSPAEGGPGPSPSGAGPSGLERHPSQPRSEKAKAMAVLPARWTSPLGLLPGLLAKRRAAAPHTQGTALEPLPLMA